MAWGKPPPPTPPAPPPLLGTTNVIWASGWIGFCLSLIITQLPTPFTVALAQFANNLTYVIHFSLIGAYSGVATQAIACINALLKIGAESGSDKCKTVQRFTPFALLPLGYYTYTKPLDLLPLIAVCGRLISFQATDMLTMRTLQLFALLPWVPYSLALGSSSALMTAALSIVLQCVALWTNHGRQLLGGEKEKEEEPTVPVPTKRQFTFTGMRMASFKAKKVD